MVELGTKAPGFFLPDTATGRNLSLEDVKGKVATVIMFICNHCPFVKHVNPELVRWRMTIKAKGLALSLSVPMML
jgi:hypothetical protein